MLVLDPVSAGILLTATALVDVDTEREGHPANDQRTEIRAEVSPAALDAVSVLAAHARGLEARDNSARFVYVERESTGERAILDMLSGGVYTEIQRAQVTPCRAAGS